MDPLRDRGTRLAEHLNDNGATVKLARSDGAVHGYATLLVVRECCAATLKAAPALRTLLQA